MQIDIVSQQNIQLELTGQTGGVNSVEIQPGGLTSGPSVTVEVSQLNNPSFTIEGIATNIEISNDVIVGGADPALANRVTAIENILGSLNRLPVAVSDSVSGSDSQTSITINVLANDTDFEGSNLLSVTNWTYNTATKLPGESAVGLYGTISVTSTGVATYTLDSRGRALTPGQSVSESISYTISDKNNNTVASTLSFTIVGSNNSPIVVADNAMVMKNKVASGNVLLNDSDPESSALSVVSVVINGSTYSTPANVNLSGVAVITMQSNGDWTATPSTDYTGEVPIVYYNVSDGNSTSQGSLFLAIALGAVPALSNPVTVAQTGTTTYNVYSDQDLDAVPWAQLTAGTVVNIHYKDTPYKRKFGIRSSGTFQNPIQIWGVTNSNGDRPLIDFNGATTCASCNPGSPHNIFHPVIEYGESLGGIVIKRGVSDSTSYKPSYIKICNLDLRGTTHGNSYTTLSGTTATYGVAAGVYSLASRYLTIENCVITENGNGVFTMAKDDLFSEAAEFTVLRNNRIYGNGVVGSYYEHNVYMQCYQPLVEGNYFGQVRTGSLGSTYKTRSAKDIIRFNHFEGSARIIDLVNSENQDLDGIVTKPEYGTDFIYGNVLVNDTSLPLGGTYAGVHFGGDNLGEDEGSATTGVADKYRKQLYFFNNVYYVKATAGFRACLFDISLQSVKVDLWNNSVIANVPAGFAVSWTEWAGQVTLRGNNNVFSTVELLPSRSDANASLVTYSNLGTITTGDPKPNNIGLYDFSPCNGSSLLGQATSAPTGIPSYLNDYELTVQPRIRTNGMLARPTSTELGAHAGLNQDQTTPTGFSAYVPSGGGGGGGGGGGTISATGGVFLFEEANGTTFANSSDFTGSGASSKGRYEIQNGACQCLAGTGTFGEILYYTGSTSSPQACVAEMAHPFSGSVTLYLRSSPGASGYSVEISGTSCTFRRAGVWQSGNSTPAGSGGTQILKLYEEGGAIKCFVDGTQIFSFTDSTPITTGSPGFSMNTSSESATRMLSWKDFN